MSDSQFKTWFNKNYSLSYNGKFCGLDRISNLPLFRHKLERLLVRSQSRRRAPLGDVISMSINHNSIKLYVR